MLTGTKALTGTGPLTGTGALTRLALRRDRIMIPAWVYLVLIGVCETAFVFGRLYKTPSARAGLAAAARATRRCCSSTDG